MPSPEDNVSLRLMALYCVLAVYSLHWCKGKLGASPAVYTGVWGLCLLRILIMLFECCLEGARGRKPLIRHAVDSAKTGVKKCMLTVVYAS